MHRYAPLVAWVAGTVEVGFFEKAVGNDQFSGTTKRASQKTNPPLKRGDSLELQKWG